jgi:hypothetical protein
MDYMQGFGVNCDYLRKKFNLGLDTSIYQLVNSATIYIRNIDDSVNVKSESVEKTEKSQKEKKNGRPKKSN